MRRKEKTYAENLADYEAVKADIAQMESNGEEGSSSYRTLLLRKSILEKKVAAENTRQYQKVIFAISPANTLRASISFSTILNFYQNYSRFCSESGREHSFLLLNNRLRLDTEKYSAYLVFIAEQPPELNTVKEMSDSFTALRNLPTHITEQELTELYQAGDSFQPLYQQIRDISQRMFTTNQAVPFSSPCAFNLVQRVNKNKENYEISFERLYCIGMFTGAPKNKKK